MYYVGLKPSEMMHANVPDWSDNDIARATTLGGDVLRFVAATNISIPIVCDIWQSS